MTDELLHRVEAPVMERYRAGIRPEVKAVCGKVWAPVFPVPNRMREYPKCPKCFPHQHEYLLAVG